MRILGRLFGRGQTHDRSVSRYDYKPRPNPRLRQESERSRVSYKRYMDENMPLWDIYPDASYRVEELIRPMIGQQDTQGKYRRALVNLIRDGVEGRKSWQVHGETAVSLIDLIYKLFLKSDLKEIRENFHDRGLVENSDDARWRKKIEVYRRHARLWTNGDVVLVDYLPLRRVLLGHLGYQARRLQQMLREETGIKYLIITYKPILEDDLKPRPRQERRP